MVAVAAHSYDDTHKIFLAYLGWSYPRERRDVHHVVKNEKKSYIYLSIYLWIEVSTYLQSCLTLDGHSQDELNKKRSIGLVRDLCCTTIDLPEISVVPIQLIFLRGQYNYF